ncbi:DoxX family protein [Skermania piniformis]|uniref:DoxX family protein n=1 Tax=Skermania pinensis TaxID=39122 RepID=A0ABX8SDG1_9ACTN|nr:DoxX family protein [Skermania piniformis]
MSRREGSSHAGSSHDVSTHEGRSIPRTDEDFDPDPTQHLGVVQRTGSRHGESVDSTPSIAEAPTYSYASIPPAPEVKRESVVSPPVELRPRRGTLDLGLLILRVAIGGTFVFHGLQKLTGIANGPGMDGVRDMLANSGWKYPDLAAIMLTVGELAGGTMLILGVATPLAAGALLAVIIDAWLVRQAAQPGWQYSGPNGTEYEAMLVAAAAALTLTGPGRYAVDGRRGWATRPRYGSMIALVAAIAAAICTWIFLHGGSPFS